MERNLERLDRTLTSLQIRHQRWRRQLAWLDADQFERHRQHEREVFAQQRRRERDFVSILRFIGSPTFAARRKQRLARVVAVEDTLVGHLLGLKNAQLKRKRDLVRSLDAGQVFSRQQGRRRSRSWLDS
jgi:hypothetical protein